MARIQQFNFPTIIKYGAGACEVLPNVLKERGYQHPLIVTDRDLAKLPLMTQIFKPLEEANIAFDVYSEIWGNPTKSQVMNGVKVYKEKGADSIIAVGGGAAMDAAKSLALMVEHPGDLFDYEDGKPDGRPVDASLIPFLIAIPTTAGTGSEVGRAAVISDDETKEKKIIFAPSLLPAVAVVDPQLSLDLPARVTASTGLDAISHLVEAYVIDSFHPLADGIALEGMRLAAENLVRCFQIAKERQDKSREWTQEELDEQLDARGKMLMASLMGATAFQKGLGVIHSCAHALSAVRDLHHGLVNGILLPYGVRYNAEAASKRLAKLAEVVGAKEISAKGFEDWLFELQTQLEIPHNLAEVGVTLEDLDALVKFAYKDVCHPSNPRPVSPEEFRALFTEAIQG